MNNLILIREGTALLDAETASKIAEFERQAKEIKAAEDELKKAILAEMQDKAIIKVETDDMTISYVAGTDRETFDSKRFRADHGDLYDEYVEIKPVAPSIRIRLKEAK